MLSLSPSVTFQISIGNAPTTVKYKSCHQPDMPVSCSLLDWIDNDGIKVATEIINGRALAPVSEATILPATPRRNKNSTKNQYSDLYALPLKLK